MFDRSVCRKPAMAVLAMFALHATSAAARVWERADMKQQVKGCSVELYADQHFRGPSWTTTNSWAALGWEFGDKISSIRVHSGIWQFFKQDHFDHQVETLFPGNYPLLSPNADRSISSFRCVKAT